MYNFSYFLQNTPKFLYRFEKTSIVTLSCRGAVSRKRKSKIECTFTSPEFERNRAIANEQITVLNRVIAGGCLNEARNFFHGVKQQFPIAGGEAFQNFTIFGVSHIDNRHSGILLHKVDLQDIKLFKSRKVKLLMMTLQKKNIETESRKRLRSTGAEGAKV